MSQHTKQCLDMQEKLSSNRGAYQFAHPSHCKSCDGWGGTLCSYDPSPAGVSLGSGYMQDFDPCFDCYQSGLCPRCGAGMLPDQELFDKDTPCHCCGFVEGDEGAEQPDFVCYCYEDKLQDLYADLLNFEYPLPGARVLHRAESWVPDSVEFLPHGSGPFDLD